MEKPKKRASRKPKTDGPIAEVPTVVVSLRHGKDIYESSGESVTEALQTLQGPPKITAKGFLTVTRGTKRFDRFFGPLKLRQFLRPAYLAIQAKQIEPYLQ